MASSCSCFSLWNDQEKINRLQRKRRTKDENLYLDLRPAKPWETVTDEIIKSSQGFSVNVSNYCINIIKSLVIVFMSKKIAK